MLKVDVGRFLTKRSVSTRGMRGGSRSGVVRIAGSDGGGRGGLGDVLTIMAAFTIVVILILKTIFIRGIVRPGGCVATISQADTRVGATRLLSKTSKTCLFGFCTGRRCGALAVCLSRCRTKRLVGGDGITSLSCSKLRSTGENIVTIVPSFRLFQIGLVVTSSCSGYSASFPVLRGMRGERCCKEDTARIRNRIPVRQSARRNLVTLVCKRSKLRAVPMGRVRRKGFERGGSCICCLSFQFRGWLHG